MLERLQEARSKTGNYVGNIPRMIEDLFSWNINDRRIGLFRDKPIYNDEPAINRKYSGTYKFKEYGDLYKFYKFLKRKGLRVYEVPQKEIRKFDERKDPIGYRMGDEIYIAKDFRGKLLTEEDKIAIAAHEYRAGHNHINSDEEAQRGAIETLTSEFPHPTARIRAIEMAKNLGFNVNSV